MTRVILSGRRPDPETPSPMEAHKALAEDGGEMAKRVEAVLDRLAADAQSVKAHSRKYSPPAQWLTPVETPTGIEWWIIWREVGDGIKVRYIGEAPGQFAG